MPVKRTIILVCFSKCRTTLCFLQQLRNQQQPDMLQDRFVSYIVKGAILLFNLFCSTVAKQVAWFSYPSYCNFTLVSPCHVPLMPYHDNLWRSKLSRLSPFNNLPSNINPTQCASNRHKSLQSPVITSLKPVPFNFEEREKNRRK